MLLQWVFLSAEKWSTKISSLFLLAPFSVTSLISRAIPFGHLVDCKPVFSSATENSGRRSRRAKMGQSSRFPFTSVLKQFSDPILYLHGGCNCRDSATGHEPMWNFFVFRSTSNSQSPLRAPPSSPLGSFVFCRTEWRMEMLSEKLLVSPGHFAPRARSFRSSIDCRVGQNLCLIGC